MSDLIDRQAAIYAVKHAWAKGLEPSQYIEQLPAVQPEPKPDENGSEPFGNAEMLGDRTTDDCISRQAAQTELMTKCERYTLARESHGMGRVEWSSDLISVGDAMDAIRDLPSAQPERTCVNCGRTMNNGGWYADGRTRCPIEEHYALPKDGYCHLWEKRNVTDDDYPERREK